MNQPKPSWLKVKYEPDSIEKMEKLLNQMTVNTVCQEAHCPNMSECFKSNTATFMILGNQCTRSCRFCAVSKGLTEVPDPEEPENVAQASKLLGLKHIVVTSVTRDDLLDGGAGHFVQTIKCLKKALPEATIEVLIPDFNGSESSLDLIIAAAPDVISHNIETVPSLYKKVRPEADYRRSLFVLEYIKRHAPQILSKTGIMVGLGETDAEVDETLDDLVAIGCEILTIGQYLRPSVQHIEVDSFVTPEKFMAYKLKGEAKGFKFVASSPLVRSSYKALEALEVIKTDKNNQ